MYLINFLFILGAITMFILPFYGLYYVNHKPALKTYSQFNRSIENFFSSQQANYLVLVWAAAEAVVWFVIPEFLLILVIFMRVHRKRQMLLYDIYGTVIGTIIAVALSLSPESIARLPYIQPNMVTQVQHWYASSGIWALFHQPFSGVPYKVFTGLASDFHLNIILFLVLAVIVRISRYVVIYGIAMAAFPFLHKYVYKNYLYLYVGVIAVFSILLYKVYLGFA